LSSDLIAGKWETGLRKSNKEAAQTRTCIVETAADHLRRTGIAEASLADIMAAAGLTHGGFYRHFRSKEHLVAEALTAASEKTLMTLRKSVAAGGVNAAVDDYLSREHRDSATPICPFAAFGSELRHAGDETKAAAANALEALFTTLAEGSATAKARNNAIVSLATMVGAMTLARAVADKAIADKILDSARRALHR
jgi:TetR/AcrR family transcriptional regulator, transcriptional repressor for nem operon